MTTAATMRTFTHTIGGEPVTSSSTFDVIDPALGETFAVAPQATRAQLDAAVHAARTALPAWREAAPDVRAAALESFAACLRAEAEELAHLLTREQGKPLFSARGEIARTADWLEAFARMRIVPELLAAGPHERVELHYRPVGVVGAITPWNVPVLLGTLKIAQALITGNTIVVKPSPYTPLTTLRLGAIGRSCFPPGVLNVVAGGNDLGRWMTGHGSIDKISFTGSTATGRAIMASAAQTMKRVTLELGGNDAAIVLDDVDADRAVQELFAMTFVNCGQICMAIKRLFVHERLYARVVDEFAALAAGWRVGSGLEPGVQMGPVQNEAQYRKVLDMIAQAQATPGARIVAGGAALDRPGYFIAPTVIADIAEGARIVDDEQFGPAIPIMPFATVDEAVARANATRFGLGASVWTSDPERGAAIAQRLDAGTCWINRHGFVEAAVPFGGMKESGVGRESGMLGLHAYVEPQVVRIPLEG